MMLKAEKEASKCSCQKNSFQGTKINTGDYGRMITSDGVIIIWFAKNNVLSRIGIDLAEFYPAYRKNRDVRYR